jgi:hypothetical protein
MGIYTVTIPMTKICYGCKFYQAKPDDWTIGVCTNEQSRVKCKSPRFATDRRCIQKITTAYSITEGEP